MRDVKSSGPGISNETPGIVFDGPTGRGIFSRLPDSASIKASLRTANRFGVRAGHASPWLPSAVMTTDTDSKILSATGSTISCITSRMLPMGVNPGPRPVPVAMRVSRAQRIRKLTR